MRILSLFPNEELRTILEFYLEGKFKGYVFSAASQEEAIKAINAEKKPFDLVIVDSGEVDLTCTPI